MLEVYDLVLIRPYSCPPSSVTTMMNVMKNNVLKCLWSRKVVEIGLLIPSTLPQVIVEVVKVVDIGIK